MKFHLRYPLAVTAMTLVALATPPAKESVVTDKTPKDLPVSSSLHLGFKFETPKPESESTPTQAPGLDAAEKVIMLPAMRVIAPGAKLTEREVLSPKGQVEFAKQKYTTPLYRATFAPMAQVAAYYFNFLSILSGWHPSEAEAMTLFREDERARIASEVDALSRLERIKAGKETDELKGMRFQVRQTGYDSLYWNPRKPKY